MPSEFKKQGERSSPQNRVSWKTKEKNPPGTQGKQKLARGNERRNQREAYGMASLQGIE